MVWHFDSRGIYTVRSGYRLSLVMRFGGTSSGQCCKAAFQGYYPLVYIVIPQKLWFIFAETVVTPNKFGGCVAFHEYLQFQGFTFKQWTLFEGKVWNSQDVVCRAGYMVAEFHQVHGFSGFIGGRQVGRGVTDEFGQVLPCSSKCVHRFWDPDVSEALALAYGLQLASDLSFSYVIAETD
ncbi:hypothetical protein GH714_008251 [Hevea brasiliensis]|uniref:RNase H type-1 domain-containing protein n=1 Tax=Hevea brasiliensis TaxID=3981 RepID=A0A6A6M1L5_HEVBR|nr:hypothetical protein GH714_008251 [Hevea brasiliensis]